ncbi:MAG TPA: dihydrofolate reductase family protein, partial [Candidatus Limnocylindria bacterium]|nr:dihydrofolate reductase family protein [Candidatus Limnocylindria bacterium]
LALSRGRIAWRPLLRKMAGLGIVTIVIEGGAAVAASALRAKAVDKIVFFYAPKILGGDGRAMIAPLGLRRVSQAISLKRMEVGLTGGDVVVVGYL